MPTFSERLNAYAISLDRGDLSASDAAYAISQIANELEPYWLQEREGEFPTPRQALALGRFLSQVMRDDQLERGRAYARVSRSGAGLSNDYLHVTLGDDYEGGIDREGRVST